jgi:hypothetical protein
MKIKEEKTFHKLLKEDWNQNMYKGGKGSKGNAKIQMDPLMDKRCS